MKFWKGCVNDLTKDARFHQLGEEWWGQWEFQANASEHESNKRITSAKEMKQKINICMQAFKSTSAIKPFNKKRKRALMVAST